MTKHYDYLIVGAGITGATIARILADHGKKVLVIEARNKVGGNCSTHRWHGINVHEHGPHIFHTSNELVYDFVTQFCTPVEYRHKVKASYENEDELYSLPFNMKTFSEIFDTSDPEEAAAIIKREIKESGIKQPKNLEEQAIKLVGKTVYEMLVKGYTEKQWGRPCTELPPYIIKRLPLRFDFNDEYFNDKYQFVPKEGYTKMISNMLHGIKVMLSTPFDKFNADVLYDRIVWTGPLDELFDYKYGKLEWRSLKFVDHVVYKKQYQELPVINYTSSEVPYTRITEHKLFDKTCKNKHSTILTTEYPVRYEDGMQKYYAVNDAVNDGLAELYKDDARRHCITLAGRLAKYKYFDMDDAVEDAIKIANSLLD